MKKRNTKEIILKAALDEFCQYGFDTTSIKKLAAKAKISHGLLYNYFQSKEELLKFIFKSGIEKIKQDFKERVDINESTGKFIISIFDVFDNNDKLWRLLHNLKMQKHITKLFKKELGEINDLFVGHIAAKLKSENYDNHQDEAQFLFTIIDGIANQYMADENYPIEQMIKILVLKYKG